MEKERFIHNSQNDGENEEWKMEYIYSSKATKWTASKEMDLLKKQLRYWR